MFKRRLHKLNPMTHWHRLLLREVKLEFTYSVVTGLSDL